MFVITIKVVVAGEMDYQILRPLCISLLGTPANSIEGEPLVIQRRQVRALLYRLAAEGKPLNRSYLSYLFWTDCPEKAARQNLSRLLVYLGKALPDSSLLLSDEVQIWLAPGHFHTDTRSFNQHWETWKTTYNVAELQAAISLYRGAFLNGFYLPGNTEYNTWVEAEAEHWEGRYLKTLSILVDLLSECGDLRLAIEYANRYLAYNDLAEDIHCKLIELHTASGERSAALYQYELCAAILERELGVKPSPETQAAYQAAVRLDSPTELPALPAPDWTVLPSLQVPIIGRQEPLDKLEALLYHARQGQGEIAFIRGEPGIGKSRLMKEFSTRSRLKTRVFAGSAEAECCTMPYQPLVEAIRPALSIPGIISQIPSVWIEKAARLFPELENSRSQTRLHEPLNAEEAGSHLFEALYRITAGLTAGGYTLVLCLDDLQWADATTLDWLAYLGRRLSTQRILLLCTCRDEKNQSLSSLRASLSRQENFHELDLEGLPYEDTSRLVDCLEGAPALESNEIERLYQATGGNPFFLLETLRIMIDQEAHPGSDREAGQLPLPETIQAAIAARVDRLHPQVRQVLEAASVFGAIFSFEMVHLTSGRQEMEILDGLDELIARQFLVELTTGYQFCHAITREAVYAGMSFWRRKKLHQRAAWALERLQSNDWAALTWHFDLAGDLGKAAEYALRAGQSARSVFAHREARASFERGLALLEQAAGRLKEAAELESNRRMRIQLLYERGWALRLVGEMEAYTKDLEEVAELAQALNDPQVLAHLRWQEAYNHRWFCRYQAAIEAAQEGLCLSQRLANPRLEALCQRELGMAARETGRYELALPTLEKALELFRGMDGEHIYTLHTIGNLSTLYSCMGDARRAMALAEMAMEYCDQISLPHERRLPLGDMGAAAILLGSYDVARKCLLESLAAGRQVADRTQEIYCLGHLGFLEIREGHHLAAHQYLVDALNLAEEIGSLTEQSWLHLGLAEAHAGLGAPDLALFYAAQAQVIAQKHSRSPDEKAALAFMHKLHHRDPESPGFENELHSPQ